MTRLDESRRPDETGHGSGDDFVPEDDRVIGRAFRISIAVFAMIAMVAGGIWLIGRQESSPAPVPQAPAAPRSIASDVSVPPMPFVDVTAEIGIEFVHDNGAVGEKLLPETMGGGVALFDYDVDGDPDLLFVNSSPWSATPFASAVPASTNRSSATMALYRNDGDWRFLDVTRAAGLDLTLYGMGVAVGDVDADGDPDVYLTAVGPNRLLRNDGGRFVDVTSRAGVAGEDHAWSTSAAFFDLEGDGDLDLFVANYVEWSPAIDREADFRLTGVGRAYGPPTQFAGTHSVLYRNDGDGTFSDISDASGIRVTNPATGVPVAKALAIAPVDLDRDHDVDLLVANDTVRNFLFRNRGDGTLEEIGTVAGVGFDSAGSATGAMGTDVADYRDEGRLGFAIGNFANEMSSLFVQQSDAWQFTDEAIVEGLGAPSRQALSFGLFFFDADLDGRLDLLQANGHIEDEIARVQASQSYRQPAQLFWNAGPDARACFVEASRESVGDLARPIVGRGASYADLDADGDLDVVLTQIAGPPMVLRNDQASGHHWVRVRLAGREDGNRDAIGAWIELVTVDGAVQRRQVMPTRSYLSQVELPVTFGLGDDTVVESLRVTWPDGTVQEITDRFVVDTTLEIRQGS